MVLALVVQDRPVVEPTWVVDTAVAEVPLAEQSGCPAGLLQRRDEGRLAAVEVRGRVVTPFTWLYVPVSIDARLGEQIELVQKQASKRIPSAAIRSRCGVWVSVSS